MIAVSCTEPSVVQSPVQPLTGNWHLVLDLGQESLPVDLSFISESGKLKALFRNSDEEILAEDVVLSSDSIFIRMPLYDSGFRGHIIDEGHIEGVWNNYLRGPDYEIPFFANAGEYPRFEHQSAGKNIAGTWAVSFSPETPDEYPAVGLFKQQGQSISGTFITETGDYRFLEGVVSSDTILLSCFDGSHAFLFKGFVTGDSIYGQFWSGTHWSEPWVAQRNPEAHLTDPDSLTFLKEGYDMVDFQFTSLDGEPLSPKSPPYSGKVLLVQVMGSWCPNCVDETRLLDELHEKYRQQGLEIIALAFERDTDKFSAQEGLRRFKNTMGIDYAIAHAGYASKDSSAAALPFLNHVMSYPTCIVIDRNGMVRKIRTGFYGPGTGNHYVHYKVGFERFIANLLNE
jgi:thiol-disulfide isomerase/thioredoxin